MLRTLVTAVALVSATSVAIGAATTYRDEDGRFMIGVPTGWQTHKPAKADLIAVRMVSPLDRKQGGLCVVLASDTPQTREMAQADIDEAFAKLFTTDFWKKSFAAGGFKEVVLDDAGQLMHKGRKAYFLVATASAKGEDGKVFEAKSKQVLHVVPGNLFFVQCTAAKADYPLMTKEFDQIFASFEARPNERLVSLPPQSTPSVLTLFAGPRFEGVAHTIAQNTANVPALTGRAISTGITIAGFGRWEVCEDVNFTGACQVVAATAEAAPGQFMRIGSVRRYVATTNPQDALGVVSTNSAYALRESIQSLARR
jgi:hypothetical protein